MKFPPASLRPLHHRDQVGPWLNAAGLAGTGCEVGSLYGGYAKAVLAHWLGNLICVDLWRNQPDSDYMDGANKLDMDEVFATFMRDAGGHPRCSHRRMTSLQAAAGIEAGALDWVFLDANHRVTEARKDILAWFPKVKVGGLFSGHDFYIRYDKDTDSDAQTAVMEFEEVVDQRVQITWCNSWWAIKTQEMADRWEAVHPTPKPKPHSNAGVELVAVLAVSRQDFHLAKKWLTWADLIRPEDGSNYRLVVFHTKALTDNQVAELINVAPAYIAIFATPPELYEHGYSPSANYQFRAAIEMVERDFPGKAMLWCEADTVPMRSTWFEEITNEYRLCAKPFLGDYVDHKTPHGNIAHMTGIAVYSPDWRIHAPSFADLPGPRMEQGWDSQCSHETVPKMARSKTIQQIWRPPVATAAWVARNIWPTTALFHQSKDGSVIDVLAANAGLELIPLDKAIAESTYPVSVPPPRMGLPRVEIFIVTFARDMDFLRYCLASIKKYASGFAGVTIAVPEHERGQYDWCARQGATVKYFVEPKGKGMMAHEIQKCRADEYCPAADFILHLDADCILFRAVTPAAYVKDGKALCVFEPYTKITNPNRHIWKTCVKAAVGIEPSIDPMVRHPQIHPIGTYRLTRDAVAEFTEKDFDEYVFGCRNEFPQGFAEFPTLMAIGLKLMPWLYEMVEYDHADDARLCGEASGSFQYVYRRDRDYLVEFWSHGGIGQYKAHCDSILRGGVAAYYIK